MHYLFETVCCIDAQTDAPRRVTWTPVHTGRVILTYFVVIIEQSLVVNVPRFSFHWNLPLSLYHPSCLISFRREQGEGKDEIPRSRKEPGIRMRDRWSLDAVTNEYFSKRYIGKVRREPGVYGRLVKVWIDEPIKLRKITSSIWEPHRGRVNNELKINGITRLCVYW